MQEKIPKILSIAGFDGSCGAGMQADLKTFTAFGCYGFTVLTALPVQNTMGVKAIHDISLQAIEEQVHCIFEDTSVDAIKIGMLFNSQIIQLVTKLLKQYAHNIPIILDPVMVAKSGDLLLLPEAKEAIKYTLFPLTTIITPNIPEANTICNTVIQTKEDMLEAGKNIIEELNVSAILIKGGHLNSNMMEDVLLQKNKDPIWFSKPRIVTKNTHGTGCSLSAAIAASIGLGFDIGEACSLAKNYLYHAIKNADHLSIGKGNGPVHHFYHLWPSIDKITSYEEIN